MGTLRLNDSDKPKFPLELQNHDKSKTWRFDMCHLILKVIVLNVKCCITVNVYHHTHDLQYKTRKYNRRSINPLDWV